MSDVKLWQPFTNGTAFIGMGLIGDRGPEWATAYTFVSEPDYRLAIARIAQLEGERDAWYKAEAKFYDIDVPAGITDRQSAVIWMQDRIATLEAALDAIHIIAVNDKSGCPRCSEIVERCHALVPPQPTGDYTDSIDVPPPCDTLETETDAPWCCLCGSNHKLAVPCRQSKAETKGDEGG